MQVANNQTQEYLYQNKTAKSENKSSENFTSFLNQQENTQAKQTLKIDKVELNYSSNNSSTGVYLTNSTNSKPLEKTTETVGLTDALQTENTKNSFLNQLLKGADSDLEESIRSIVNTEDISEIDLIIFSFSLGFEKNSLPINASKQQMIQATENMLEQASQGKISFEGMGKEEVKSFLQDKST